VRNNLIIVLCFLFGILVGRFFFIDENVFVSRAAVYVLYLLIFCIGVGIGSNAKVWQALKEMHFKILLMPFTVVFGTMIGVGLASFFLRGITLFQSLAVGAGFGYYSLSSVIIAKEAGDLLGVTALIANLLREIVTLLFAPLMAKLFGKFAPFASGGATAMDTTLPVIARVSGKEYAVISIFSGVVLTLLVPIVVPLLLALQREVTP
jgi:uncharacterized membrane protein YbjE (DUF340 family)